MMSNGYRRLPVGTTGTKVDYNGQIVIWPNPNRILTATTDIWTQDDVAVINALARLNAAQSGYFAAALPYNSGRKNGGVGTTAQPKSAASELDIAYSKLQRAIAAHGSLHSKTPASIRFAVGNDETSIADIAANVQTEIDAVHEALIGLAKDKASQYTFTIKADLATSGGKSTPVHVDGYDNITSTINIGKSDITSPPATQDTPQDIKPLPIPPPNNESTNPQDAVDNLVRQRRALMTSAQLKLKSLQEPTEQFDLQPASIPATTRATQRAAGTSTPAAMKKALTAAATESDLPYNFNLADSPRGVIDLRATPADQGYILRIIPTLTVASKASTASAPSPTPPPRGDNDDFSIDRTDYSLKLSGNVIFVNQIGTRNNSFAPAASAAISLHYHPRTELKSESAASFWSTWNTIDPAVGLNLAALNLNNATTNGKSASNTSSGSSGVQVGMGGQLSFYHDIFQVGYGADLQTNKNRQYWYVGISVFDTLNKVGNLNLNLNVPSK